jgi:hypothetical protein
MRQAVPVPFSMRQAALFSMRKRVSFSMRKRASFSMQKRVSFSMRQPVPFSPRQAALISMRRRLPFSMRRYYCSAATLYCSALYATGCTALLSMERAIFDGSLHRMRCFEVARTDHQSRDCGLCARRPLCRGRCVLLLHRAQ